MTSATQLPQVLCAGAVALPHLLYFFTWTQPRHMLQTARRCGEDPVRLFAKLAALGKVLQFGSVALWYASSVAAGKGSEWERLGALPLWRYFASAALLVAGQVLNLSTYSAIGEAGVYYGCRLGKKVPWCSGFPFSVVSHPQYVGSVLTVLAFYALAAGGVPGVAELTAFWVACYGVTALQEEYL